MKKILSIAFLSLMMTSGCKKNLVELPLSAVSVSQFYKNATDITAAMAGMYGSFQETMIGESNQKSRYLYWGEARSDNFKKGGNAGDEFSEMEMNGLTALNDWATWEPLYKVIARANTNIKYLPQAAELDPKKSVTPLMLNNYLAQCYALRAVSYFYIVRTWGDAPLWTTPYESLEEDSEKPRTSQATIIDEVIIADLKKAYDLVDKISATNVFYINEGAICATLVDVYMWKKDYANAILWFQNLAKAKGPGNKVYRNIDASDLESKDNWKNIFVTPAANKEAIWNIHWDGTKNGCACMSAISTTDNNTSLVVEDSVFVNWPKKNITDIRVKQTFDVLKKEQDRVWKYQAGSWTVPGVGNVTGTYVVADANRGKLTNIYPVMYRLSDQYLLYAEALNKTGNYTESLKYLNFIRVRAGLTPYLATDAAILTGGVIDPLKLEDVIIQERQWELFGEGKRWFDLVRTDRVIPVMDPIIKPRQVKDKVAVVGWGTDKRRYYWPIFRNVMNANSKLVQNLPY